MTLKFKAPILQDKKRPLKLNHSSHEQLFIMFRKIVLASVSTSITAAESIKIHTWRSAGNFLVTDTTECCRS